MATSKHIESGSSEKFAREQRKPKQHPKGIPAGSSDEWAKAHGGGHSAEQRKQQDGTTTPSAKGFGRVKVPQGK